MERRAHSRVTALPTRLRVAESPNPRHQTAVQPAGLQLGLTHSPRRDKGSLYRKIPCSTCSFLWKPVLSHHPWYLPPQKPLGCTPRAAL